MRRNSFLTARITFYCVLTGLLLLFYFKAGDTLISYLSRIMGLTFKYGNRCTFLDAFIFRNTTLSPFEIKTSETPISIQAKSADIEFDYTALTTRGAFGLRCVIEQPKLRFNPEHENSELSSILKHIPDSLTPLTKKILESNFDKLYCDIVLCGDNAEIYTLSLFGEDIHLRIRGTISENQSFDLKIIIACSPETSKQLPEQVRSMLQSRGMGWMGLEASVENNPDIPLFKLEIQLENDTYRLSYGREVD